MASGALQARARRTQRVFNHTSGAVSFNYARVRGGLVDRGDDIKVHIKAEIRDDQPIVEIVLRRGKYRRAIEIPIQSCTSPDIVCTSDFLYDMEGNLSADLSHWTDDIIDSEEIPQKAPKTDDSSHDLGWKVQRYFSLMLDEVPRNVHWTGDARGKFTKWQRETMDELATCGGTIDILLVLNKTVAPLMPDFIVACNLIAARNLAAQEEAGVAQPYNDEVPGSNLLVLRRKKS